MGIRWAVTAGRTGPAAVRHRSYDGGRARGPDTATGGDASLFTSFHDPAAVVSFRAAFAPVLASTECR